MQKQGTASEPSGGCPRRTHPVAARCVPGRRRPNRVLRHLPGKRARITRDLLGMAAARVRTSRFLLQWRTVQPAQGVWDWRQPDRVIGGPCLARNPAVSHSHGDPRSGCARALRAPRSTARLAQSRWQNFLKAAVARYGPTGSYWTTRYRQLYGANATPLPIQSWQVWNEPNLKKYFDPGNTTGHGIDQYAQLVRISHAAIKSRDPQARIVLGGMLGYGNPIGGGLPQRPLQEARRQGPLRRRSPAPLYGLTCTDSASRSWKSAQ